MHSPAQEALVTEVDPFEKVIGQIRGLAFDKAGGHAYPEGSEERALIWDDVLFNVEVIAELIRGTADEGGSVDYDTLAAFAKGSLTTIGIPELEASKLAEELVRPVRAKRVVRARRNLVDA